MRAFNGAAMKYVPARLRFLGVLTFLVLLGLLGLLGASASACSSSSAPASPKCDPTKCAPGNDCIDDGSGSGASCHETCTGQTCPFGWYCNDGQPKSWCVQSTLDVGPSIAGQWGTPCLPGDGEGGNKACDSNDGFSCYGVTPTDANAMCTVFGCVADSDCPGGWWCETVNTAPSVKTATRSFGKTRTVCLPRQYCATCQMDHDCPAAADGTQQHCILDANSNGFCSPQCASNANCALDARCKTQFNVCAPAAGATCKSDDDCPPANNTYQHCNAGTCTPECGSAADCNANQQCQPLGACVPRAGVCLGDGSFCAPCRADTDCKNGGFCLAAAYSTEHFCSQAMSSGTCPPDTTGSGATLNAPPAGSCPTRAGNANYKAIACTIDPTSLAPANQCLGLVVFGTATGSPADVPGCWTVNR
jgi:hypothetical protein